jgi:hypothetical protein
MKRIFLLVLLFTLASSFVLAATASTPNQGVLTSVNGKVQIKSKSGKKTRKAKQNSTVVEGERIVTGTDAKATLQLFDGSELNISPKTDFQLTKLQKPSAEDKVIQFKLFVGRLFASVKKLASSKSSFEIEAGGVVCGVRGTKFAFEFDPGKNHVGLRVDEGTVYTNWNGHTSLFTAGQNGDFTNGNLNGNTGGKGNGEGNGGKGGNNGGPQTGNPLPNLGPSWNMGGLNGLGNGGNQGGDDSGGALSDLNLHFGPGINGGHGNGKNAEGNALNIQIVVPPGEAVP